MKNFIYIILLAGISMIISSCEKVIEIDVDDAPEQLVIEGVLNDDGGPATVLITKSVALNADNIFPAVNNATVILTDDAGNLYNMNNVGGGYYQSDSITTVTGRTYTLSVNVDGKSYTAQSTLPAVTPFDSLGIDSTVFGDGSFYSMVPYHYDPPVVKNYYRYKIFVNGDPDIAIYTDNDDFTDGRYVSRPFFSDSEIEPGDVITMEMYNIDEAVHLYFYSLAQSSGGDEASATPANPVSNFSGGCLGYFSVQTKQTQTKAIP
jgi:hypothetical protein